MRRSRPTSLFAAAALTITLFTTADAAPAPSIAITKTTTAAPPATKKFDVAGQVVTPAGKPCAGAKVLWMNEQAPDSEPIVATTDGSGKFRFTAAQVWPEGQKEFFGAVLVKAEGYGLVGHSVNAPNPLTITVRPATSLRVKVVDSDGNPLAGVPMRIEQLLAQKAGMVSGVIVVDFCSPTRPVGRHFGGTTASDGSLVINDLPQGGYVVLQPDDEKYAMLSYDAGRVDLDDNASTAAKPITLGLGAILEGTVSYSDGGKGLPGVEVTAQPKSNQGSGNLHASTDADGHYRITQVPPGAYTITAKLPEPLDATYVTHAVTGVYAKPAFDLDGFNLSVVKGATVAGEVTYRGTGAAAAGVTVDAYIANEQRWAQGVTDGGGQYQILVPGGTVNVAVQQSNTMSSNGGVDVAVTDGATSTCDLTTDAPVPPAKITGVVLNPDGTPAPNAGVTVVGLGFSQPKTYGTDEKGEFSIDVDAEHALVHLTASLGNSATEKPVPAIGGDDITLKLADNVAGSLSGTVVDDDGAPVAKAQVSVVEHNVGWSTTNATVQTGSDGTFRVDGLEPGNEYSVNVTADGFAKKSSESTVLDAHKIAIFPPIKLEHANSFLAGQVVGPTGAPVAGANLTVTIDNVADNRGTTDENGKFHIDSLPEGRVSVDVSGNNVTGNYNGDTGVDNVVITCFSTAPQPFMGMQMGVDNQPKPADFIGRQAPDFSVAGWVDSPPMSMASLRGKFVLVDAYGCCVDNLKESQSVMTDFGSHGIIAIGLRVADQGGATPDSVTSHLTDEHVTLPVAVDAPGPPMFEGATGAGLGITGFENYALLDRQGNIVYVGSSFDSAMQALSRELMLERTKTASTK